MDQKQTSFKRWHQQLDEPVPLNMVPQILKISRQQVAAQVKAGKLRVYSFRTQGGKVFRMVPCADLKNFGKNPLTLRGMTHAFKRMLAA